MFFCGVFWEQLIHVDNDKNSAIDNELASKVKNISIEKCNESFYQSVLTVHLVSNWQTLRLI
jgi:hypothetical protein